MSQPLLVGQSLELWRGPLAAALRSGDAAGVAARARRQLEAGAGALDLNAGARGRAEVLLAAHAPVRRAAPGVPLWLDSGDVGALLEALRRLEGTAAAGPLVANAVPLGGAEAAALLAAAAVADAGVVLTPRLADVEAEAPVAVLRARLEAGVRQARAAGIEGPLYLDALGFPPAHDRLRARRSLALLRSLRDGTPGQGVRPLVAVGNVGHGVPRIQRAALRSLYAALALGAGAGALLLPVEDARLRRAVEVVTGRVAAVNAVERWLLAAHAAAAAGASIPFPPGEASAAYRVAHALLAGD